LLVFRHRLGQVVSNRESSRRAFESFVGSSQRQRRAAAITLRAASAAALLERQAETAHFKASDSLADFPNGSE
jgi:hypothetical protein